MRTTDLALKCVNRQPTRRSRQAIDSITTDHPVLRLPMPCVCFQVRLFILKSLKESVSRTRDQTERTRKQAACTWVQALAHLGTNFNAPGIIGYPLPPQIQQLRPLLTALNRSSNNMQQHLVPNSYIAYSRYVGKRHIPRLLLSLPKSPYSRQSS